MTTTHVALSVSDLREIAKRLDQWEKRFYDKEGGFKDATNLIERMEVHRPDSPGSIIGHFVLDDGWLGFLPSGWSSL